MTEAEWLDPRKECAWLLSAGRDRISDRKARLFACACARVIWPLLAWESHRELVEVAEAFADGLGSFERLAQQYRIAHGDPDVREEEYDQKIICPSNVVFACAQEQAWYAASRAASELYWVMDRWGRSFDEWEDHEQFKATLLREIVGNPFRPVVIEPAWLAWNDGTVPRLATTLVQQRTLPRGRIDDLDLLEVLSDALEEAGCTEPSLLEHLRDPEAKHVYGCWALDPLLGKE
jgi:hypothetical protein